MIVSSLILAFFGSFLSLEASSNDTKDTNLISFEFKSGGAYHISGHGEWIVSLKSDGVFEISHDVGGEIEDYGSYALTGEERSRLWGLTLNFDRAKIESSVRMGTPDEVMYIIIVKENNESRTTNIWIDDAREIDEVTKLVDYIGILIEKYTGVVPVLR